MKSIKYLALLIIGIFIFTNESYSQIQIIANKSVKESSINKAKLKNIYTLDTKQWSDGSKIIVVDQRSGGAKEDLCKAVGQPSANLAQLWMRVKLSGEGNPPTAVSNDDEMLSKVASIPGAIGYVTAGKANSSVQVLLEIK